MVDLQTVEEVINFAIFIKELIVNYKHRDSFLNSINIFMDSISQSMEDFKQSIIEGKIKKDPSLPKAFEMLSNTLSDFKAFLEKENKSNKIMKFLKGSSLRKSSQEFMDNIQKQLNSLHLAVTVRYGNEHLERFDDVVKMLEIMDEKLNKVGIMQNFQNQIAADFWIQNFGEDQTVESIVFMKKFQDMVYKHEKYTLEDNQIKNILALLDEDQQQTVNYKQWDVFYNNIWSFFERKQELIQKKNLIIQSDEKIQLPELILTYLETHPDSKKQYDYPINHVFRITSEYYTFVDISNQKVKVDKNLTQNALVVGKKKPGVEPDIYFDGHLKTISGKQFQISAKKYLNVNGYFITDLSSTNCTCLKVESKPYAINNHMIIDLNGHIFEVLKVTPEPNDEDNKNYYFVPTAGMENLGDSLIEETIKKCKNIRNSNKKTHELEESKNEEKETTLKRKPRALYGANKQQQPTLIIVGLEGMLKDQKFELKTTSNKDFFIAGIGSAKDNVIVIDEPETIMDYNCQIVFSPEFNCWLIAEKWPKSKQTEFSLGTLIYLKTAEDFKKEQAASFSCKIRDGMKIFFNCHVLLASIKE